MRILSERQERLLGFVGSCNSSGYRPTEQQVLEWLNSSSPRRPESQISVIGKSVMDMVFAARVGLVVGTGEDDVEHAVRLEWLEGNGALLLTPLGKALLQSAERTDIADEDINVVDLGREDPLSYPKLFGRLAALGEAMLVDPYLRLEGLNDVVTHTSITRVLISKQHKNSHEVRAALGVYLGSAQLPRQIEVRATADTDVHDRIIVSSDQVHVLGHSLNGIAKASASTLLIRLPDAAASGQRQRVDQWWANAESINPVATSADGQSGTDMPDTLQE